jgi:hypothetical protein
MQGLCTADSSDTAAVLSPAHTPTHGMRILCGICWLKNLAHVHAYHITRTKHYSSAKLYSRQSIKSARTACLGLPIATQPPADVAGSACCGSPGGARDADLATLLTAPVDVLAGVLNNASHCAGIQQQGEGAIVIESTEQAEKRQSGMYKGSTLTGSRCRCRRNATTCITRQVDHTINTASCSALHLLVRRSTCTQLHSCTQCLAGSARHTLLPSRNNV